eukprot:236247-Pleurochrysis_carterae.AAC.2
MQLQRQIARECSPRANTANASSVWRSEATSYDETTTDRNFLRANFGRSARARLPSPPGALSATITCDPAKATESQTSTLKRGRHTVCSGSRQNDHSEPNATTISARYHH